VRITHLSAGAALALVAACVTSVQTRSGADYLARDDGSYDILCEARATAVDGEVRRIAAVEPYIRFPARIGPARIGSGRLTAIPEREAEASAALAEQLDRADGELIPASSMIAAMVSPAPAERCGARLAGGTIGDIRRGAAREHLGDVIAYEVATLHSSWGSAMSAADLTVIGMFVLPGRSVQAEASAGGTLIDVRNGYPYARMTAFADRRGLSRTINSWEVRQDILRDASANEVLELADKMSTAPELLQAAADEKAAAAALADEEVTADAG
jgi:hypothetical protein